MSVFGHHIHHCDDPMEGAPPWAVEIDAKLDLIIVQQKEELLMALKTLDQAVADATDLSSTIDSFISFTNDLQAQVAALKTTQTDPATAAKIDALDASITATKAKAAAAMVITTSGTPTVDPTTAAAAAAAANAAVNNPALTASK